MSDLRAWCRGGALADGVAVVLQRQGFPLKLERVVGWHRARRGSRKLIVLVGRQRGRSPVDAAAVDGSRRAPVVGNELRWVQQHEGGEWDGE
jgi:hypothetical protein